MLRVPQTFRPRSFVCACALIFVTAATAAAQDDVISQEGYLTPPDEIADAVLAPWQRNVSLSNLSPDARFFLVSEDERRMAPLSAYAKRHYNLGGLMIDPAANRSRSLTTRGSDGLRLISARDASETRISVPNGAKIGTARWSPDGSRIAFFGNYEDGTYLFVADPESGRSSRLTNRPVLATLVTSFEWSGDGRYIFAVLVPEGRGAEPPEPAVALSPRVDVTTDEENRLRTYPDLITDPYERDLLEYHTTGQLARIDVSNGRVHEIGEPAMIEDIDPAPDGEYVIVETIRRPFSNIVPVSSYATVEELWDSSGDVVVELASNPIRDGGNSDDDDESDEPERRSVAWRPDGQGLGFLQRAPEAASDDEEQEGGSGRTDRVMQWLPPFEEGGAQVVYESERQIRDVEYSEDARTLFIEERNGDTEHLYAVSLDDPETTYTIYRWDTEDDAANPGGLMTKSGPLGLSVVRTSSDGGAVYLSGTRYHEDPLENAPQPFIDRVTLADGETTRIFESAADRYERVGAVLDDDLSEVIVRRESPTEVPNDYLRNLDTGQERRLTDNQNYSPDLTTQARREVVQVERVDGVRVWVNVTLPADFSPGDRLPAMFWFYPREYETEDDYAESNSRYNKNRFPSVGVRSMDLLLRRGYAVVEPDLPIIGERRYWNDNYVPHLRNTLSAVIDELDRRGYIDRARLAIGGHSYGGFGTINAMIHTPYFRAGIAGASNTNRTLTPAGFQRESRTLWESREVYMRMSPLFWANELNGALLMYHGMEDQNVGTFPINSERFFHAANVLGKTAALYMYPYETHGQQAEETILDMWARWTAWLDTYVKGQDEPTVTVDQAVTTELMN